MRFDRDITTGKVTSIDRGGVIYTPVVFGEDSLFKYKDFRIARDGDGYRWSNAKGPWERYDSIGRSTSYGKYDNTISQLLYADPETLLASGMADLNGTQVIWFEYDGADNLIAVQDVNGRRVEYSYANNKLTQVTDVLGGSFSYEYDSQGRITRKVDQEGRATVITYSAGGAVSSVIREGVGGKYFRYGWEDATEERYAQIKTTSGNIKEVWYNKEGDVLRVMVNDRLIRTVEEDGRTEINTDEKGNVTRTTRNEWGQATRIVYPDKSEINYSYESQFHRLSRVVNQRGIITDFDYDERGNLTRKVEALGTEAERATRYEYDQNNQLITLISEGDAVTAEAVTRFTYDLNGNIATITDTELNTTEFLAYDGLGNALRIRNPLGHEWNFSYDDAGRLISVTDPQNNVTRYEYDGVGNRTAVINAQEKRVETTYTAKDLVASITNPYGQSQIIQYNSDGLPVLVKDETNRVITYQYDNEKRLRKTIVGSEQAGYEIGYQYDESPASFADSNNPVQIDYPSYSSRLYYDRNQRVVKTTDLLDGSIHESVSVDYDSAGNRIAVTDKAGRTTRYVYDALNRVTEQHDVQGNITRFTYDDRNNLLTLTDANGGTTRFEYDLNSRQKAEIRPLGQTTQYEYDAAGNRVALIDAKGQKIAYVYDSLNRLTEERYYAANDHANPVKTINYGYDNLNRMTSYDDGTTSGSYSYDDQGRLLTTHINYGSFTLSHSYSYYANGLKQSFTDHSGDTYQYFYDDANRLSAIELPNDQRVTYNSYDWNAPTKITLPGGSTLNYAYDALQRVTQINSQDPLQSNIMVYNYEYAGDGNITAKRTEHGDYLYGYDELNRLISVDNPNLTDEAYSYDPLGNRLTSGDTTTSWIYNLNNQLQSYDQQSFVYDDNGNMIQRSQNGTIEKFNYNIADRLTTVESEQGTTIATYYYDPFGRRLWKEVNGQRTYFAYSDEGLAGEYNAQGQVIKTYGFKPNSMWTTDPLFQKVNNSYYWYQNDHLGTPQKLIDSNGTTVWAAEQTAFGQTTIHQRQIENNLRFPGQYHDQETGLSQNYYRDYDVNLGRYVESDPISLLGGSNVYLYAMSNSILFGDNKGLDVYYPRVNTGGVMDSLMLVGGELVQGASDSLNGYRDSMNNVPLTEEELLRQKDMGCVDVKLEPFERAIFHMQGLGGANNKKYTFSDGREAVYDKNGDLVTDPRNKGTYNFCQSNACHLVADIVPWVVGGTGADDPTSVGDRIEMMVEGALVQAMLAE